MATDLKKNKKTLVILIPAFILLVIIGVSKVLSAKKTTNSEIKEKTESFIDPDLDYSTDTIKKKSEVYKVGDEKKEEEEEIRKKSNISLDQLGNMAGEKKNSDNVGFESLDDQKPVKKEIVQQQKPVKSNVGFRNTPSATHKNSDVKPFQKEENGSSMGVYVANSSAKTSENASSDELKSNEDSYLVAILEEDTKVRDNTNMTFILNRDAYIRNVRFKKNSVIYATASSGNNAFEVVSYTVKNASDGKKYPVHLVLYNENLSRGIRYEGNLGNAMKQGQRDALDDAVYQSQGTNTATSLGTTVARGTVRSLQRQMEVNISEGYKVNFKVVEDRQ